jgi:hypothetical protein
MTTINVPTTGKMKQNRIAFRVGRLDERVAHNRQETFARLCYESF